MFTSCINKSINYDKIFIFPINPFENPIQTPSPIYNQPKLAVKAQIASLFPLLNMLCNPVVRRECRFISAYVDSNSNFDESLDMPAPVLVPLLPPVQPLTTNAHTTTSYLHAAVSQC